MFFFPRLISAVRRVDVYHTSTHGVALVQIYKFRMQVWNVLQAARWKYSTQKMTQIIAICSPLHNFVGLNLRN